MVQKALVFYSKPWDFNDEKTGERKQGITIEYVLADNLKPVKNDDGSRGYGYCKESLSLNRLSKITQIPAFYNLQFALKTGAKGKPQIKLDDIDFLSLVNDKGI